MLKQIQNKEKVKRFYKKGITTWMEERLIVVDVVVVAETPVRDGRLLLLHQTTEAGLSAVAVDSSCPGYPESEKKTQYRNNR